MSQNAMHEFMPISADDRQAEKALRLLFVDFWASAGIDLRAAYDALVSSTPAAQAVSFEPVADGGANGWWVRPETPLAGAAILFLHGGGYILGTAAAYRNFVSQIVDRTQIPALVIDYPLAPEATLPAAPQTALRAWRWLREQGFDKVAIAGDSAGGGLTLVTLAELAKRPDLGTPVAATVFSPWTDLSFTGTSMTDADIDDPVINLPYLQDCAVKYRGTFPAGHPLASPLYGDLAGLPPTLIQVGTDERLLDDSRQYAERAAQAGSVVVLEVWEGMHHVFQLDVAHLESSRLALDRAARFLITAFGEQ